jgi:hypothetical protein
MGLAMFCFYSLYVYYWCTNGYYTITVVLFLIYITMEKITINWIEYNPVPTKKEEKIDSRIHKWRYWYPNTDNTIFYYINHLNLNTVNSCNGLDYYFTETWDSFETKEEAQKELKKRKAIVKLKRHIIDTWGVFEPDWDNARQDKTNIYYHCPTSSFRFICNNRSKNYSPIWYLSEEKHAKEIISKFDKELRIIWDID